MRILCALLLTLAFTVGPAGAYAPTLPRSRVAAEVASMYQYIGLRYRYGGESLRWGADCSGFTMRVFQRHFGVWLPHKARLQARYGVRVGWHELQPFDLVFFGRRYRDHRYSIRHVGIYLGRWKFIHCSSVRRRVIIEDLRAYHYGYFITARRLIVIYDDHKAPRYGTEGW